MNKIKIKFLSIIFAFISIFSFILSSVTLSYAYADSKSINFDSTNVLDDLRSSEGFNILDYPYSVVEDKVKIINFVEYCYSFKANMQDNYGLYVYLYNPRGKNLDTKSKANMIQMATAYDSNGKPSDYEKFTLEFCSKSEESNYKNLFYKFKVVDRQINGKYFSDRVNSNQRRYDISGVELLTYGSNLATEYGVGGTYLFTGYAKGYGPDTDAESTLNCFIEELETVELSVKHTFYRSNTSPLGVGHQNQLDTVYFSVPQRLIEEYGRLQRIKAEWYEYKTKEILVTSHNDFHTKASPYIGVNLGPTNSAGTQEYNEDIYYSLGLNAGSAGGGMNGAKWGWNLGTGFLHVPCQALYYMFLVDSISEYDPYASTVDIGGIQSNDLYQYILNYNKTFEKGMLPIKDGTISADLFESDIDASRKINNENGKIQMGYSFYDFDADVDLQVLQSWSDSSPSFWENWVNFGLGAAFTGGPTEASRTVAPIQILKAEDLKGTPAEIANRLMINSSDVDDLKKEYTDAITVDGIDDEEKVVVLFRFATSDYYSEGVDIMELGKGFLWSDKYTKGQAYIARESVFLNFDIVQLTFNKDGDYTVIPVVSSPIDIVNDITSPVFLDDGLEWWQILLAFLLIILLLIILWPIMPYIIKGIWWVICLPFKFIKWIVNGIKGKSTRSSKKTLRKKAKKKK